MVFVVPPVAPEGHYKEKLQRRCCKDGLRAIPMPYSCTRRSLYITEGSACIRAFRYCCATYRGQEVDTEMPTTQPPTTTPTTAPMTTLRPRPTVSFPSLGYRRNIASNGKISLTSEMFREFSLKLFLPLSSVQSSQVDLSHSIKVLHYIRYLLFQIFSFNPGLPARLIIQNLLKVSREQHI